MSGGHYTTIIDAACLCFFVAQHQLFRPLLYKSFRRFELSHGILVEADCTHSHWHSNGRAPEIVHVAIASAGSDWRVLGTGFHLCAGNTGHVFENGILDPPKQPRIACIPIILGVEGHCYGYLGDVGLNFFAKLESSVVKLPSRGPNAQIIVF